MRNDHVARLGTHEIFSQLTLLTAWLWYQLPTCSTILTSQMVRCCPRMHKPGSPEDLTVELASDPDADDLEPGAVELQVIGSGRGGCCGSWSEVFNTYGRLSNAHLLCECLAAPRVHPLILHVASKGRYGFILQGNSHDLLTLHTESEDPGSHRAPAGEPGWPERWPESELVCSPVKADHLAEANVEWDKKVYIDADGRLDFRSWLRLIDLAAQALALPIERPQLVAIWRLQQDVYNGQPAHGGRLGAVLQEVAGKLTHAVEARLKTYFRSEQPVDDLFELVSQDAIHDVLIGYIVGEVRPLVVSLDGGSVDPGERAEGTPRACEGEMVGSAGWPLIRHFLQCKYLLQHIAVENSRLQGGYGNATDRSCALGLDRLVGLQGWRCRHALPSPYPRGTNVKEAWACRRLCRASGSWKTGIREAGRGRWRLAASIGQRPFLGVGAGLAQG